MALMLVALLLTACAEEPAGPNAGNIVPGKGVAEVSLGDSRSQVEQRLGKPDSVEGNPFNKSNVIESYYGRGLELSYDGDTVGTVVIHPTVAPWTAYKGSTAQGVWVETTPATIKKKLGAPQKELSQALIYAGLWIRLTQDGKVESMSIGG